MFIFEIVLSKVNKVPFRLRFLEKTATLWYLCKHQLLSRFFVESDNYSSSATESKATVGNFLCLTALHIKCNRLMASDISNIVSRNSTCWLSTDSAAKCARQSGHNYTNCAVSIAQSALNNRRNELDVELITDTGNILYPLRGP